MRKHVHSPEGCDFIPAIHHNEPENLNAILVAVGSRTGTGSATICANSLVDLEITDPDGLSVSRTLTEIPGALYREIRSRDNASPHDLVGIPFAKEGAYDVAVIPDPDAKPTDTFSLEVTLNGVTSVLADDQPVGTVPEEPFSVAMARIDIVPRQIVVRRKGVVPVDIFGREGFDAGMVDPASLRFGATGDEQSLRRCSKPKDKDGDGHVDLRSHFNVADAGFAVGDVEGRLKGTTFDDTHVLGVDSIVTR